MKIKQIFKLNEEQNKLKRFFGEKTTNVSITLTGYELNITINAWDYDEFVEELKWSIDEFECQKILAWNYSGSFNSVRIKKFYYDTWKQKECCQTKYIDVEISLE